jgi:hypothetical protein
MQSSKLDAKKAAADAAYITKLLYIIPPFAFILLSFLVTYALAHYPALVWISVAIGAFFASVMLLAALSERNYYLMFLSSFVGTAIFAAVLAGYANHSWHMRPYYAYFDSREYYNVLPSEPALAHADAGKIVFADTAQVDQTRGIGYDNGARYCIAPIIGPNQGPRIEYWAVGENCCQRRSGFSCDDATQKGAGAIVQLDAGFLRLSSFDQFRMAVKVAEGSFELSSAPDALFVRYVADPDAVHAELWTTGTIVWLSLVGIHLVVNTGMAFSAGGIAKALAR